jgi:pyruvate kinase
MRYSITSTLGPSSADESTWRNLLSSGTTSFRLNTSHLNLDELMGWVDRLKTFLAFEKPGIAVTLDLQGSKWRLGDFKKTILIEGQLIKLVFSDRISKGKMLPVPHLDFFRAMQHSNGEIVLNDGRVILVLETAGNDWLTARVKRGSELTSRKGITCTASTYRIEEFNTKDQAILQATQEMPFICYAISYVKDAAEMSNYRSLVGKNKYLIAKLERGTALEDAAVIADIADELWLCRGDLGAELGLVKMAAAVNNFSGQVKKFGCPTILAGQVLEHMVFYQTPTRSEICILYDALKNGYKGFVLSDETAVGKYPFEACRVAAEFRNQ